MWISNNCKQLTSSSTKMDILHFFSTPGWVGSGPSQHHAMFRFLQINKRMMRLYCYCEVFHYLTLRAAKWINIILNNPVTFSTFNPLGRIQQRTPECDADVCVCRNETLITNAIKCASCFVQEVNGGQSLFQRLFNCGTHQKRQRTGTI